MSPSSFFSWLTSTKKKSRSIKTRRLCQERLQARTVFAGLFIDTVNGDDSADGLTEQTAWRSTVNIGYRSDGAAVAPRPYQLQAGDSINFIDGTNAAPYYSGHDFGWQFLMLRNVKGTAEKPITIRGVDLPTLNVGSQDGKEMSMVYVLQSSHIKIESLALQGGYGSAIMIADSRNVDVNDVSLRDIDGKAENNLAGVHIVGSHDVDVSGSSIIDVYDRTKPGNANNRPIVVFGSMDVRVLDNYLGYSEVGLGFGVEYKHLGGLKAEEALAGPFIVEGNMVENATEFGISSAAPTFIRNNLVVNGGIRLADIGGTSLLAAQFVTNNTIVNTAQSTRTGSLYYAPTQYPGYPLGKVEFSDNVVHDQREYKTGEISTLEVNRYGSNDDYSSSISAGLFHADRNLYSVHETPRFDVFGSDERFNSVGGIYSFAQWQALGYDRQGAMVDLALDDFYATTNRDNAGWSSGSKPRLNLLPASRDLSEDGTQKVRITRSGMDLSAPLVVSISSNAAGRVSIPTSVVIPAGSSSIDIVVSGKANSQANDNRDVQLKATAADLKASTWLALEDSAPVEDRVDGVFQVPGTGSTVVKSKLTTQLGEYRSELGLAVVDDENGTVNGVAPTDPGWINEVLKSARVHTLVSAGSEADSSMSVEIPAGSYVVFYLVQNASLEQYRTMQMTQSQNGACGSQCPVVFTSIAAANIDRFDHVREELGDSWTLAWEDLLGGGDQNFTDMIVDLTFSEAKQGHVAEYAIQFSDAEGRPVTSVSVGDSFFVDVLTTDKRNNPAGVFSAGLDIEFTPSLANVVAPVVYGPAFPNFHSGTLSNGRIDELGAMAGLSGAGTGGLVARIPMKATTEGMFVVTSNAAELPEHQTTLLGMNEVVKNEDIVFGSAALTIKPKQLWHNSQLPEDVNGDGMVSPLDALQVINWLNEEGAAKDFYHEDVDALFSGRHLDVDGDGLASPVDALRVINRLNKQKEV